MIPCLPQSRRAARIRARKVRADWYRRVGYLFDDSYNTDPWTPQGVFWVLVLVILAAVIAYA